MKEIQLKTVQKLRQQYEAQAENKIKQRAVMNVGLGMATRDAEVVRANPNLFSLEIDAGEIHDQERSGRCWLFANLVFQEVKVAKKLKVDAVKLSKAYLYFYDKLEMANSFYQHVIDEIALPLTHKKVQAILRRGQYEGGGPQEAAKLVAKYGLVPEKVMPEVADSTMSGFLNEVLDQKLHADAKALRETPKGQLRAKKAALLDEVYQILATALGTPPSTFSFDYRPKEKKSGQAKSDTKKKPEVKNFTGTPQEFYRKFGQNTADAVELSFTLDRLADQWNKLYETDLSDPIYGQNETLATVKMSAAIKQAIIKQLQNDEPVELYVAFYRQVSSRTGILDPQIFKYREMFDMQFGVAGEERGLYHDVWNDDGHAMSIVGVHLVDGQPVRWKVKNSHGKEKQGHDGYFVMSDAFMDQLALGVWLRQKYLPNQVKQIFAQKPTLLKYWE